MLEKRKVDAALRRATDDRFEFDPKECSLNQGKWVFNRTNKPLYTDISCPYLDRQVSCVKNGKRDLDYQKWEWEPDDCILPRSRMKTLHKHRNELLFCLLTDFVASFARAGLIQKPRC